MPSFPAGTERVLEFSEEYPSEHIELIVTKENNPKPNATTIFFIILLFSFYSITYNSMKRYEYIN
jgi:hypothetical protein